ncbi:matrix protein import protein [Schizosaccharomyces cryophilus OY26]|uniref:Phosphatidate cytidylyltransferase, mitochondrial n=1 Tax=Schizosaccharomyces cryophilus (strain OY26 / ATCC MYA-4695 / CBS 11777 / NBRC 106824 / NRRL Y48691) TaxID=653667 RepID=S9W8F4_SCHCR|nr:matrix protein import protein [Schizosaccharomyces cryophilus OY26]EPY54120.1 matrix protein import protein [Schizosaccharomyces cryophilus OY26]
MLLNKGLRSTLRLPMNCMKTYSCFLKRFSVYDLVHQDLLRYENQKMNVPSDLKGLLDTFNAPIQVAIGYGSGVFQQAGYGSTAKPMVDFIFQVDNPVRWHELNIQQNPSHYSFLKYLGPKIIANVQDNYGANIYYNTQVRVGNSYIKYGVIKRESFIEDLENWSTLYTAGRCQKPVALFQGEDIFFPLNHRNLEQAASVALFMLPDEFSEFEFYKAIVNLSYLGDIRMSFLAENPKKVDNIVSKQLFYFRKLYLPILYSRYGVEFPHHHSNLHELNSNDPTFLLKIEHNSSKKANDYFNAFPSKFRDLILSAARVHGFNENDLWLRTSIQNRQMLSIIALKHLTQRSILTQSAKGVLTAGLYRSISYSLEKLKKGLFRFSR